MSADDALWGSLTRLASEAGRLVRSAAEATGGEISGALGRDRQVLRWPSGLTPLRPAIPEPYVIQGRSLDWRDAYMAFCEWHSRRFYQRLQGRGSSLGQTRCIANPPHGALPCDAGALPAAAALQRDGVQPVAVGLVAAQTVLHFRPGGYNLLQVRLPPPTFSPSHADPCLAALSPSSPGTLRGVLSLQVGLNPHRVLHHGEWRRLGTSLVLHADLPHLVTNCTALLTDGLPLERRLGTVRFAALVATSAALTQALHCELPACLCGVSRLALADCLHVDEGGVGPATWSPHCCAPRCSARDARRRRLAAQKPVGQQPLPCIWRGVLWSVHGASGERSP